MNPPSAAGRREATSRLEWIAVAAFVVLLIGASALPYLVVWSRTPAGEHFTGACDDRSDDLAPYLARMRAGGLGRWTYQSPYAPGIGPTVTIRPFFHLLGALTVAAGAPLWAGVHAARLFLGAGCLLLVFALARSVARSPLERWGAFLLATIGSGIGWMTPVRLDRPASMAYDLWVSEMNAALSLLSSPHFVLSIILMLACLWAIARSLDTGRAGPAAWGGVVFGYLALEHAYDVVVLGGVLAGFAVAGLLRKSWPPAARPARSAAAFLAAALPGVVWVIVSLLRDPSLAHMARAQRIDSPWALLAGLGLLAPLAIAGVPVLARRSTLGRLLAAWCVVVPLLIALPTSFQRRMLTAWHVPLGIAAGLGLVRLLEAVRSPAARRFAAAVVIVAASLSTVHVYTAKLRLARTADFGYRTWLPAEFVAAYDWLQAHAAPRSVVLGPYTFSNFLPVYTDLCAYYGHWAETPDDRRRTWSEAFYLPGTTDAWRAEFLSQSGVDWVLAPRPGSVTKSVALEPARIPGLTLAWRSEFLEIYRVQVR